MCQSKKDGGLRCHHEAKRNVERLRDQYALNPTPENEEALHAAEHELQLTATKRKELRQQIETAVLQGHGTDVETVALQRQLDGLEEEHAVRTGETAFTRKYDSYDDALAAYEKELEHGYNDLTNPEEFYQLMDVISRFHGYSPRNQMLIKIQNPNALRVAGFKKWSEEFNRTVRKGSRAVKIFAPVANRTLVRGEDGKPELDGEGKKQYRQGRPRFALVSVFGDNQTEGDPLPTGSPTLTDEAPEGFVDDLTTAINQSGFTVRYDDTGFASGYTRKAAHEVVVSKHASPAEQAHTLAHELSHIKQGHLERPDEYHSDAGGCRGEMEMEAEALAYVLCRSNGMSTQMSSSSGSYIREWQTVNPDRSLRTTVETVSKTAKELLGEGSWRNLVE